MFSHFSGLAIALIFSINSIHAQPIEHEPLVKKVEQRLPRKLVSFEDLKGRYPMRQTPINFALDTLGASREEVDFDYHIKSFRLIYETTNPQGEIIKASALVLIRSDYFEKKLKPRSWISYQHGARFESETSPSTMPYDPEALATRIFLALEGHLVVIADYLGLGVDDKSLQFYLNSSQQSLTTWNALEALKEWNARMKIPESDHLFLAGYSQGGSVTLALQKKMQMENLNIGPKLSASFPMAGPYDFGAFSDDNLLENANPQLYGFIAFMIISLSQIPKYNIDIYSVIHPDHHEIVRKVLAKEMSLTDFTKAAAKIRFDFYSEDFFETIEDKNHPVYKATDDQNLVNGWAPEIPTYFMSSKDDEIIPYRVAEKTVQRFQEQKAYYVELIEIENGVNHVDATHPAFIKLRDMIEKIIN